MHWQLPWHFKLFPISCRHSASPHLTGGRVMCDGPFSLASQLSSHLISCLHCAARGLSCCTVVGSPLRMSPLEKTIILAHPALPESSLHWQMGSKVTLLFSYSYLCLVFGAVLVLSCWRLFCLGLWWFAVSWGSSGGPRVVTPRGHQGAINGEEAL